MLNDLYYLDLRQDDIKKAQYQFQNECSSISNQIDSRIEYYYTEDQITELFQNTFRVIY